MNTIHISQDIHVLHANIRKDSYFEGFWQLERGVSINCYLLTGQKNALIDLYSEWENADEQIENQLQQHGFSVKDIDFLVMNHMESDHSASVASLMERNKKLHIYCTEKACALLKNFIKLSPEDWQRITAVKTGDTLSLGKGRNGSADITLEFYETPNVHWPETMMSYEKNSATLFSCDGFGSYGALGEHVFDDELTEEESRIFEKECLMYYATVVASFGTAVKNAVAKIKELQIRTVAPSHGIIWRAKPQTVIQRYERYAGYNTGGEQEKHICVICGSMYGHTAKGMQALCDGIRTTNIPYTVLPIPETPLSRIMAEALRSKALVLAFPTYEYKMYPPAVWVIDMFCRKHLYNKEVLRIGSWGWTGGAQKEYEQLTSTLKWTQHESIEWQGMIDEEVTARLREAGARFASSL